MKQIKAKDEPAKGVFRKRATVEYRHDFSQEEYNDTAKELTKAMGEVVLQEEQIKAQAASAKAKLKELKAEVSGIASRLDSGGEMRKTEAFVDMDRKRGQKTLFFNNPGHANHMMSIRVEAMDERDFQELPLDEQPAGTEGKDAGAPKDPLEPTPATAN